MSKLFIALLVLVLVGSGVVIYFGYGPLGGFLPTMLVVYGDSFAGSPALGQYLAHVNQTRRVQAVSVSEVLSEFSVVDSTSALTVRGVEGISSSMLPTVILIWFNAATKTYNRFASLSDGLFWSAGAFPDAHEVYLDTHGKTGGSFTLTYDGGKSLVVTIPSAPDYYYAWGDVVITTSGSLAFKTTKADSIHRKILSLSPLLQYVVLIGSVDLVPGFTMRMWSGLLVNYYVTDHPYSVQNAYTVNKMLSPWVPVGRVPAESEAELQIMVNKALSWQFWTRSSSAFLRGSSFVGNYQTLKPAVSDAINRIRLSTITEVSSVADVVSTLNSGLDNIIIFGDGTESSTDAGVTASLVINEVHFQNSALVFTLACDTGRLSQSSLGHAFLADADSQVGTYVGSIMEFDMPMGVQLAINFYDALASGRAHTVGEALLSAKQQSSNPTYPWMTMLERLVWNLTGFPELVVA